MASPRPIWTGTISFGFAAVTVGGVAWLLISVPDFTAVVSAIMMGNVIDLQILAPEFGPALRRFGSLVPWSIALMTVPVAVGVAILKHRLYDVDRLINRTLVYGALTATLGLTYWGSVLVLQYALRPLTQGSGIAIVGDCAPCCGGRRQFTTRRANRWPSSMPMATARPRFTTMPDDRPPRSTP